jgi:hypothetical protein
LQNIFDNEEDYNREIVKSVYISFLKKLIDYLDYRITIIFTNTCIKPSGIILSGLRPRYPLSNPSVKILKSVNWALGWNMNMDMDMDTSILENILNITPSGVIVGSDVWGGGYGY